MRKGIELNETLLVDKEFLIGLVGKTVRFKKSIEDWESYAEEGMHAIVKKFYFDEDRKEPVHKLWFDFSPFEEENHKRQNANYYDNNRQPTLTAVEAGYYTPVEDYYIDSDPETLPFELVKD